MQGGWQALVAGARFAEAAGVLEGELASLRCGHPFRDQDYDPDAAPLLEELGRVRWFQARFPEASEALATARRLREARGDDEAALATVIERQAALAHYVGDPDADGLFRWAIAAWPKASLEAAVARRNYGAYLRDAGKSVRAARELVAAEKRLRQLVGTAHPDYAAARKALATLWGSLAPAEEALHATLNAHPDDHPFVAGALLLVGRGLAGEREYRRAPEILDRAEALFIAGYGEQHPLVAITIGVFAEVATGMGDLEQAAELAAEAARMYAVTYAGHRFLVPFLREATRPLMRMARWEEALVPLLQAAAIDGGMDVVAADVARCYERLGRDADARAFVARRG